MLLIYESGFNMHDLKWPGSDVNESCYTFGSVLCSAMSVPSHPKGIP